MSAVLFWHTWSPMHRPGPMWPELLEQAENPMQEPFPTVPELRKQAPCPRQEPFPMLGAVFWRQEPLPPQDPFPTGPGENRSSRKVRQAKSPLQELFPMGPGNTKLLGVEQAACPLQEPFPMLGPAVWSQAAFPLQEWFLTLPVLCVQESIPTQEFVPTFANAGATTSIGSASTSTTSSSHAA